MSYEKKCSRTTRIMQIKIVRPIEKNASFRLKDWVFITAEKTPDWPQSSLRNVRSDRSAKIWFTSSYPTDVDISSSLWFWKNSCSYKGNYTNGLPNRVIKSDCSSVS